MKQLASFGLCYDDDRVWVPLYDYNALFSCDYDMDKLSYVSSFDGKGNSWRVYSSYVIGNKVYFVSFSSCELWIMNKLDLSIIHKTFETGNNCKYYNSCLCNDRIWFVPNNSQSVDACYDVNSDVFLSFDNRNIKNIEL